MASFFQKMMQCCGTASTTPDNQARRSYSEGQLKTAGLLARREKPLPVSQQVRSSKHLDRSRDETKHLSTSRASTTPPEQRRTLSATFVVSPPQMKQSNLKQAARDDSTRLSSRNPLYCCEDPNINEMAQSDGSMRRSNRSSSSRDSLARDLEDLQHMRSKTRPAGS